MMGERLTQTKNVLQDIAVAAAVDSRARRFAHLSPHSLSLSPPCSADGRGRGRTIAEASEGAMWNWHFPGKHSLASSGTEEVLRRGRPAGRSVAAVAGVGEGGRVGLSLARPAAAAWLSLPSLSTTSGNSLSEKETHFSRTCEFKCRPGRFLCLWVQRLRWTEQTA